MKILFKKIALLFNLLFNFEQLNDSKKINTKLEKAVSNQEVDKIILKGRIITMVKKYLRVNANSKYIPKEIRNNTEIRERVLAEFGEQMNKLGIKINSKLELI
jgi:hypothetical protein